MSKFYHEYKIEIWAATVIFALIYLTVHFFIFDKYFVYMGFKNFILQGRAHLIHVIPIFLVFAGVFGKEGFDRYQKWKRKRREYRT